MPFTFTKKIKQQGASNKYQTLGEKAVEISEEGCSQSLLMVQGPTPFIDKISVTLNVPPIDAEDVLKAVWTQFQNNPAIFGYAKSQGGYQAARVIRLEETVLNPKKYPRLQLRHGDGLAAAFRIEFVPVDLGYEGLSELNSILTTLVPNGWNYFIEHGKITRIDVAVDFPARKMSEFHFLPTQAATVQAWSRKGRLQTYQCGQGKSDHTQIYDRKAKRIAKGTSGSGKEGIRVERRLKGKALKLGDLASLANPFTNMHMVPRLAQPPSGEKRPYIWQLFLSKAELTGLTPALALLPIEKRTMYRKHLKQHALDWWDPDAIWASWPSMLDQLQIGKKGKWI